MAEASLYDYVVVNDVRAECVGEISAIIGAENHRDGLTAYNAQDLIARRVRVLLGYPADTRATRPCPPVPDRFDAGPPEPCPEDSVPGRLLRAFDPVRGTLPADWPAVVVRAVTAALGRTHHAWRYRELVAFAALERAVRNGTLTRAAFGRAMARAGLCRRTQDEWQLVWRRVRRLPALRQALRCGALCHTKVRAIGRVATPETAAAWVAFARPRRPHITDAAVSQAPFGALPPAVPDGLEPLLPMGWRVPEQCDVELTPAQWAALERLRSLVARVHGLAPEAIDDSTLFGTVAGWYLVATSRTKAERDTIVYQRSPEARLPLELRTVGTRGVGTRGVEARGREAFAWADDAGAMLYQEIPLPPQRPGQAHVPAEARNGVTDRDGARCAVGHCPHDRYCQYNHGRLRAHGGIADILTDQLTCDSDNDAHANGQLLLINRPDGGVWCFDGAGRYHPEVSPVGQQLDAPLRERLWAAAHAVVAARWRGGRGPPQAVPEAA